jgi:glycosyltransferase involved in cell wall biosynthesis
MAGWAENEINARGLGETVIMPGRFPLARMPSFYASADVLLVTLKHSEVFAMTIPGKVQSYLAAGRPIIGMLDGEGAAVITEANAGMVCKAGDAPALALLAQKMADLSAAERSQMSHAGQAYYLQHFDRVKLMNEIESILLNAGQATKTA